MRFRRLMEIVLCVLGIILILQGLDIIFNWKIGLYLFISFWLVVAFELGVGFCRYTIDDECICELEDKG